ncbi:hypothetical protein [Streptomyces sp. NBC_00829]|uniref:hypothetical protein n=1 Tax=Streptomyces sp. NBC_00829 TaxID=2903679 RepID=UPI00386C82BE|nr:hypothetical protein OG293_11060 [Streptomyces sp. NBC_00829]
MSENSNTQEAQTETASDPAEAIRADIHREYAGKLAQAEMKAQAAKAGIALPEGFADYLDTSKLLGEDGQPSSEAVAKLLEPFQPAEAEFPQLAGSGYNRSGSAFPGPVRPVSLDARLRK